MPAESQWFPCLFTPQYIRLSIKNTFVVREPNMKIDKYTTCRKYTNDTRLIEEKSNGI